MPSEIANVYNINDRDPLDHVICQIENFTVLYNTTILNRKLHVYSYVVSKQNLCNVKYFMHARIAGLTLCSEGTTVCLVVGRWHAE